eukprot:599848-Pyramimonas_sp.AAC.1
MKSASSSSRFTPLERGCIRSLATNAVWTRDRALSLGDQVGSTVCQMCGVGPDTLLHRLWSCQHCDEQRRE